MWAFGAQAVADGVDILSLSIGPDSPPGGSLSTFLNILDIALLNAVKANVLVVQAAGNGGPYAMTVTSFSPWVLSIAAGQDDRVSRNTLTLGNRAVIVGTGLARKSRFSFSFRNAKPRRGTRTLKLCTWFCFLCSCDGGCILLPLDFGRRRCRRGGQSSSDSK